MIGVLKYKGYRYTVLASAKFESMRFYLKPFDTESALYIENISSADYPNLMDSFSEDYVNARYRLDIESGLKFKISFTNREFAAAVAVAYIAGNTQTKLERSRKSHGEYAKQWVEEVKLTNLEAKFTNASGIVQSCQINTPDLNLLLLPDESISFFANTEYYAQLNILLNAANNKPLFNTLTKDAQYLYTLAKTYVSLDDRLEANIPPKTSYLNVKLNLNKDLGYYGSEYLKSKVIKSAVNMGVYQTIEEVREAYPDKNTAWIEQCNYKMVTDETLDAVMSELWAAEVLSFDTETTGLNINFYSRTGQADELVGVCISPAKGTGYYFPLQHKLFKNLCDGDHNLFMQKYMKDLLETKPIVCHNLSYDWKVAYIYEINVNCVFDTILALGVTQRYEQADCPLGLKATCSRIFNIDMFEIEDFVIAEWKNTDITFADLPYELVARYGPADADITLRLYYWCLETDLLNRYGAKRVFDLEVNFAKVVAYSEFWGYHIDINSLPELEEAITSGMDKAKAVLFELAGKEFNPNSSVQLSKIIFSELYPDILANAIIPKATTAKDTLKELLEYEDENGKPRYPFVAALLEYRRYETTFKNFLKKKTQYINPDGFVFPSVQQLGTNTGRLSIKEPNYQSYNDVVKKHVTGRDGYYIFDCDFAQIEYRVLASMAGQEALIKAFDDPDLDYHTHQAARMFSIPYAAVSKQLRQQSKGINFGLPYGMGDESLGKRVFGAKTPENTRKAADLRKRFFDGQDNILHFFERVRAQGVKLGYTETWLGRRRYYHKDRFSVASIRRQAGNHCIQGCLSGDVRVQTQENGITKISDIVGKHLHVWDGEAWTKGDITYSGKKQKCIVRFTDGREIICSPDHKFAVVSHKGNTRFVPCKDLVSKETAVNRSSIHRVKFSYNYKPSDAKYSSAKYYNINSDAPNANNCRLEDIGDSFGIGVVLGRLASDGNLTYNNVTCQYCIRQIVAEHEFDILPELQGYMDKLNAKLKVNECRADRNERLAHISVHSKTLASEVKGLDIRHHIDDSLFADTELLRGFLRGMFDGDGGVSGEVITLVQGTDDCYDTLCRDIQKALLFFGIRARYRCYEDDRYALSITKVDIPRFLELIGFMSEEKNAKASKIEATHKQKTFGRCVLVESVTITDEYIDMYDVCNTERGYYVADGIVTHNSAADIWKLATVRLFNRVVKEGWLGKVLFDGFIHDELMGEVSVEINPYEFIKAWREEYELSIDKFCRLYAGFGWGSSWYEAKKADYPPYFIDSLVAKADQNIPWDGDFKRLCKETKADMYNYETKRVSDWLLEAPEGTILAPHIGGYLYDKVSDWWADIVEKHPEYADCVLKKDKKKPNARILTLDEVIKIFSEHENITYRPNWIIPPDDASTKKAVPDAPVSEDCSEISDEEARAEAAHNQLICEQTYHLGFFLDAAFNRLYLKFINNNLLNQFVASFGKPVGQGDLSLVVISYSQKGEAMPYLINCSLRLADFTQIQEFIRISLGGIT